MTILADHQGPSEGTLAADRVQEQLWVLRAQRGDQEAFESLVTRYERQLLYYLTQFANDPGLSADALQDVWVTVFRGLNRLRTPQAFRVWLYQVAHNRVVTLLRREAVQTGVKEAWLNEQDVGLAPDEPEYADAELVHRALAQIQPWQREVLVLRFFRDLTLEEIAEVVGVSLGTVKSRLHYAKQAVKAWLEVQSNENRK